MGKKAAAVAEPPPVEDPIEEEEPVEDLTADICEGEFVFQDGSKYCGQYLKAGEDILMHGEGHLQSGPESFRGLFVKGAYKSGEFTSCSGEVYKGAFRDNLFDGVGAYRWLDGREYTGMWHAGHMHGRGRFLNFVIGGEEFVGFSLRGDFKSAAAQQAEAKRVYLEDYTATCTASATAALRELAEKAGSTRAPRKFIVPGDLPAEGDTARVELDRALAHQAVEGPFPEGTALVREALAAFVAHLAEGAEHPLIVSVYEGTGLPGQRLDAKRILLPQLQFVGQVVEFALAPAIADAEPVPGTIKAIVLMNVSDKYRIEEARWKAVFVEVVPPATE